MSSPEESNPPPKGQFLVYQTDDGQLKIDVRLQGETAWLTQSHLATLFHTTIPNVNMHFRNIFAEGELQAASVIQEFLITADDGKKYRTNHYNLDAIISVGYRVKSAVATRFRIWATQQLREYIVKGFVLDDERLKNPDQPFDYFDELPPFCRANGASTPHTRVSIKPGQAHFLTLRLCTSVLNLFFIDLHLPTHALTKGKTAVIS